jgi:hypothetical protein
MYRVRHFTVAAVILALVALVPAQTPAAEVTKAPYEIDAARALEQAAASGRHALIYFFSET